MKKKYSAFIALGLALTLSVPAMAAETVTAPGSVAPYSVEIDGTQMDVSGKAPYLEGEVVMVPVRAVAEALGYTVIWTAERANEVQMDNGTVKTTVTIGQDLYYMASSKAIGMSAPTPLGAAPAAFRGVTFVPVTLFPLLGNGAAIENTVISFTKEKEDNMTQIPNPMKEYETAQAAFAAMDMEEQVLPTLPEGYTAAYYVISGDLFELQGRKEDSRIVYRISKGDKDISGNYNVYIEVKTETIGDLSITTKGENGTIYQAVWTAGDFSYALFSDAGMTLDQLTALVQH